MGSGSRLDPRLDDSEFPGSTVDRAVPATKALACCGQADSLSNEGLAGGHAGWVPGVAATNVRLDMTVPRASESASLNRWTIAAVAVVVYVVSNLAHEAAGHGVTCLLTGGQPEMLNAVFFECGETSLSPGAVRWIAAAGTLANLVLAGISMLVLRVTRPSVSWRLGLVLLVAVNLLQAFGYLAFSGVGRIGDWAIVCDGIRPEWTWRVGLTLLGGWLYFVVAPRIFMPELDPFLGRQQAERKARASTLTLIPYLAGGATYVLAGLLNPHGWQLVLISAAAASLGGTSLLAWYPPLWAARPAGEQTSPALGIPPSPAWWVVAALVLAVYVAVLGPGVRFATR